MQKRVCKRCLLREMELEDRENLQKYLTVIKEKDKVDDESYEKRLGVCKECDFLTEGTCLACGCYVEFRAAIKNGRCPKKKWC